MSPYNPFCFSNNILIIDNSKWINEWIVYRWEWFESFVYPAAKYLRRWAIWKTMYILNKQVNKIIETYNNKKIYILDILIVGWENNTGHWLIALSVSFKCDQGQKYYPWDFVKWLISLISIVLFIFLWRKIYGWFTCPRKKKCFLKL